MHKLQLVHHHLVEAIHQVEDMVEAEAEAGKSKAILTKYNNILVIWCIFFHSYQIKLV